MASVAQCLGFTLVLALSSKSSAICPQGFGSGGLQRSLGIPDWPQDQSLEELSKLHVVTLGGFKLDYLNEDYLEGPTKDFEVQGRETYWQASGNNFLYYCMEYDKWRIAAVRAFSSVKSGNCLAFVSDVVEGRDVRNKSLIAGFAEVIGDEWSYNKDAGTRSVATLGEQLEVSSESEEEVECDGADETCSSTAGPEEPTLPFIEKESKCPVTRTYRKAKASIVHVTNIAKTWVRRLFPKLLGAPDEEDAIPKSPGGRDEVSAGSCNVATQEGCTYREQFYIAKQRNSTAEKRSDEQERLQRLTDIALPEAAMEWVRIRLRLLRKMEEERGEVEEM